MVRSRLRLAASPARPAAPTRATAALRALRALHALTPERASAPSRTSAPALASAPFPQALPSRSSARALAAALALTTAVAIAPGAAPSDPARIVAAEARTSGGGWSVSVTLRHGDTGWDDYADGWRIVTADGTILATRPLAHPHVTEQPFTRSLSGLDLPAGTPLYIESSTSVTGWSGARHPLALPGD